MNKKTLILVVILFALIVFGMFQYAVLKSQELRTDSSDDAPVSDSVSLPNTTTPLEPTTESPIVDTQTAVIPPLEIMDERISAVRSIVSGEHAITGSVTMDTPCYTITSTYEIRESFPEQVLILLTPVRNSETCSEGISEIPFSVTFMASPSASVELILASEVVVQ